MQETLGVTIIHVGLATPASADGFEFNGFTVTDEGTRTPVDFEGIDVVNFGATSSGTVATIAAGARYRFNDNVQIGVGYETPITDREDIMDWRVYVDLVLSF